MTKKLIPFAFFAAAALFFSACKTVKPVVQETPVVVEEKKETPAPQPEPKKEEPKVVEKMPEFVYDNVQFEFNSSVLKTSSYQVLEQIGQEMKKYPSVKFNINGHASIEGTEARNKTLSIDRANSVKTYFVNFGVDRDNLTTNGFGASQPIASNNDEAGRSINRRVEIKKN
ncbi:MAG TPA: OmpA family protein [Daejeonella sp.]|nr:OmpA family protein [Daejeonella sp.]